MVFGTWFGRLRPPAVWAVRRAAQRDGPRAVQPSGAQEVRVPEGPAPCAAATRFRYFASDFCGAKGGGGRARTPALAAKLTDHVRTVCKWLPSPAV